MYSLYTTTAYMRQLNLPPIIWNVSHLKIFPLELLGPAIGLSAGPSSCKGKILRWDTTTNSPTTNKCLILDVCSSYHTRYHLKESIIFWSSISLKFVKYYMIFKSSNVFNAHEYNPLYLYKEILFSTLLSNVISK